MSDSREATRKPGRPTKELESRKRHRVQVAMTDEEVSSARQLAKLNGQSVSGAVVEAIKVKLKMQIEGLDAELQELRASNQHLKLQIFNLRNVALMTRLLCRSIIIEDDQSVARHGRPLLDKDLRHSIEMALRETEDPAR